MPAPANLLRLSLPFGPGRHAGAKLEAIGLLLRSADLEFDQPVCRTCASGFGAQDEDVSKMAGSIRHWPAAGPGSLEAEQQGLEDRPNQPATPPEPLPPAWADSLWQAGCDLAERPWSWKGRARFSQIFGRPAERFSSFLSRSCPRSWPQACFTQALMLPWPPWRRNSAPTPTEASAPGRTWCGAAREAGCMACAAALEPGQPLRPRPRLRLAASQGP